MQYSAKDLRKLPDSPGIYYFWHKGVPIYIGKAIDLKRRISSYFSLHLEKKTATMVAAAEKITYIKTATELESLLLEARLINSYQPKYNIIAKDDKHPLYIRITDEECPRVLTARKIETTYQNLAFFGPFPSSSTVKMVLKMLRRIFPFSDHKLGKKACFYYHLGLCNPCPNIIKTKEEVSKYRQNILHIKRILSGNTSLVVSELKRQMLSYSAKKEYENANLVLSKIKAIEYISQPITNISQFLENPNLLEDIRERELTNLQKLLKINSKLHRIECFDVSHISGSSATASQVTFIDGEADKSAYRSYRIRQANSQSDTASLEEIATRRLAHIDTWGKPDLIIVDGGFAQVNVFFKFFAPLGIPVTGIAKKRETLVLPSKQKIILAKGPVKNLIQRIRNEAHRFAQRYHHQLMKRSLM